MGAADPACPTCGQPAPTDGEQFPFCSLRCKQVDLYRWITGDVALERVEEPLPLAPPPPPDEDEDEDAG